MAQLPDWQPLDGGVRIPDATGSGRVVAVVASEKAVATGWAGAAVLEIARAWSRGGDKVILADGALHYPTLHTLAEIENTEGLSDAALFGASIRRVARPVDGGSFFLITAGTAVADANTVPGSPRWGRLLDGFQEAGVKLLIFVRDGDSGCAAFLGSASDIIVLAERGERAPAAVRDLEGMVRIVAGPSSVMSVGETGESVARPPVDWTASSEDGQKRVKMLGVVAIAVIVLIALVFVLIL